MESMELEGEEIGSWLLEECLGAGGMGEVYRVTHMHLGLPAALKLPHISLIENEQHTERFRREALALMQCKHPNIIEAKEFGVDSTYGPYLVLELLEGCDLGTLLEEEAGPLEWNWIKSIFLQLCSALQEVHRQGMIHRDLKPSNVFLVPTESIPQAKLLDFGASKIKLIETDQNLTTTGVIVGTPSYLAPEQIHSATSVTAAVDIYAMGVMLYQAITGQLPLTGETLFSQLFLITEQMPPALGIIRQEFAGTLLESLVQQMLAKAPQDRPQTTQELEQKLSEAFEEFETGQTPLPAEVSKPNLSLARSYAFSIPTPVAARFEIQNQHIVSATEIPYDTPVQTFFRQPSGELQPPLFVEPIPPSSSSIPAQTPASSWPRTILLFIGLLVTIGLSVFLTNAYQKHNAPQTTIPPKTQDGSTSSISPPRTNSPQIPPAPPKKSFFDNIKIRVSLPTPTPDTSAPRTPAQIPVVRPPSKRPKTAPRRIAFPLLSKAKRAYRRKQWAQALQYFQAHIKKYPARQRDARIKQLMKSCRCALGIPLSWESCEASDYPPGVRPPNSP